MTAGSRAGLLALALGFVLVVGTANAGGYRFGVSDQAFYIPAIEMAAVANAWSNELETVSVH